MLFMFFKIAFSIIMIITVFASAILFASRPYGGPKKFTNFLRSIWIYVRGNTHNLLSAIKLIKRRGLKSVYKRYPKTTDFIVCSFLLMTVIIFAIIFAGLF